MARYMLPSNVVFRRVIWIVLDSVGIGAMPDAAHFGDPPGADTLGNIARLRGLHLPNLAALGLGNIKPLAGIPPAGSPAGALRPLHARLARQGHHHRPLGNGRASTSTGPFPLYPHGFPPEIMDEFERRIGRRSLGNKAASGTEIIQELGAEHMRTGSPIVYTSADSVFQVAAHEEVIPLWELYKICETAREILRGPHEVGRVIARPFLGAPGNFTRTANRHDYAVPPPKGMLLDRLEERGVPVHSVGKIFDVFLGRGIREYREDQEQRRRHGEDARSHGRLRRRPDLRQPGGFRSAVRPPQRCRRLRRGAGRVRRAGCRGFKPRCARTTSPSSPPTTAATPPLRAPTTPASTCRCWPPGRACAHGVDLGLRASLSDIGQTVAANFGAEIAHGTSFLQQIL